MRDCVFLVADETMRETFEGFLTRDQVHLSLGCGPFAFDPDEDLIAAVGTYDAGVYESAHEYLMTYQRTHAHAVAVFDREYGTERTADESRDHVLQALAASGWDRGAFEVIVIEPELEAWLWTGTPHVRGAFRTDIDPRDWLQEEGLWPRELAKPPRPKEAAERICDHFGRRNFDKTLHREIVSRSGVGGCVDPAFGVLRDALRRWFPTGGRQ